MRADIKELDWGSAQLCCPKPDAFAAYYPQKPPIPGLEEAAKKVSGGHIELALGYGSTFNGDPTPSSLVDFIAIVRDPHKFYQHAISIRNPRLGTVKNAALHSWLNAGKTNFYPGTLDLGDSKRGMKIGVISHDRFLKQARGGRPDSMARGEGAGYLYLAGRLQKAILVPVLRETTSPEQDQIDQAINQARIDGVWLALGLVPDRFNFDQMAGQYVNLSYAADVRVERAKKAQTLLNKNAEQYQKMLEPILAQLEALGIIESVDGAVLYQKKMSLSEETVKGWLVRSRLHAAKVNYLQNIWTYGPLTGIGYVFAKIKRSLGGS